MAQEFDLTINGKSVAGAALFDVVDPATGEPFAKCPRADEAQLNEAVAAAKAAFEGWSITPIEQRAGLVNAVADRLHARAAEFAALLVQEQGKPFEQAMFEIMASVGTLRVFTGLRPDYKVLRELGPQRVVEHRTPLGVVAAIMPWNFPLLLMMTKVAPALVAGNTVVAKPAPTTPLTTLLFGEICRDVLPAGVFNVICDQNDLGALLTGHPDVAKIAFTGSTATGRKVMAAAASSIKRLTLELGGNDAAIVLDDVDPAAVAARIFEGSMSNAGQICFAIKRVYVHESLYEPFCAEMARLAAAAVVDSGMVPGAQIGPVQNLAQFEKLKSFLAEAHAKGTVIAGGAPLDRAGYFIPPTIVRDIPNDATLVQEEQFGPVLPILKFSDVDEVLTRANHVDYGLCGSVWGRDVDRATKIAMRVDSGTVWVNQTLAIDPLLPFRGVRESGFGAELGQEGLNEYTQAHIVNTMPLDSDQQVVRCACTGSDVIAAKAAVARELGGALVIEDVDLAAPRAGEIRVRLVATGVCHTDILAMNIPGFAKLPIVLGHEGSGVVEAIGPGVTKVAPGDHVVMTFDSCGHCPSCVEDESAYCHQMFPLNFGGMHADGTTSICQDGAPLHGHFFGQSSFASHSICGERNIVKVRKDAPLELLGPLGCGIQTGAGAILNVLRPRPDQSLVIFGTGAVGLSAIMAARFLGVSRIIGVDVVPSRLELAKDLGATDVIDATRQNPIEAIREITGYGANFSFNTTTLSPVFEQALYCLAPRGVCSFVSTGGQRLPFDPGHLLEGRSIRGIVEGDSKPDSFIPMLVDLFMQGEFPMDRLVKYYPFATINDAIRDTAVGAAIKPVLLHG